MADDDLDSVRDPLVKKIRTYRNGANVKGIYVFLFCFFLTRIKKPFLVLELRNILLLE